MAQTTHTDLSLRLTLDDLIMASSWDKSWVLALMDEDIIYTETPAIDSQPYFNSAQLPTVRLASRLRREFNASPQAIALILDLLEELRPLRQLQRQVRVIQRFEDIDSAY